MLQGQKSIFYTDIKMPIKAGMKFGTNDYKIKKVGFDVIRQYFDTEQRDWQIGSERIKRVINQ